MTLTPLILESMTLTPLILGAVDSAPNWENQV